MEVVEDGDEDGDEDDNHHNLRGVMVVVVVRKDDGIMEWVDAQYTRMVR